MKIAVINDTHAGVRNSNDDFIAYSKCFYDELFEEMDARGIHHILHLGDIFDSRKAVNVKAMNHLRKDFLEPADTRGYTMDLILGNHDVFYKNTNRLNAVEEIITPYKFVNIVSSPKEVDYDGLKIALIPWITDDNLEDTMKFVDQTNADWVAGHFEFTGFEMSPGHLATHGMDPKPFERFDKVLSGHYHTKSSKGNVFYLGSQMEFTWIDSHDPKYWHVIDTEKATLEPVRNKYDTLHISFTYDAGEVVTPEGYVFDEKMLESRYVKINVLNRGPDGELDKFIEMVENHDILGKLIINESFSEYRGEEVEDSDVVVAETPVLLKSYVDAAESDLDKDKLNKIMYMAYVEAQNMESGE